MSSAGQKLIAGRVPGERIATTTVTSNSGTITTTETVVASVTAALVAGRTYKVSFRGAMDTSVAGDTVDVRMREDNLSGTELQLRRFYLHEAAGRYSADIEAEFTAVSSGNKTFVVTYDRLTGSGNIILIASGTIPSFLYVDYIRG